MVPKETNGEKAVSGGPFMLHLNVIHVGPINLSREAISAITRSYKRFAQMGTGNSCPVFEGLFPPNYAGVNRFISSVKSSLQ